MALAPGVRLGPYEVAGEFGAGWMGEVYRATDAKLKREVALGTHGWDQLVAQLHPVAYTERAK